MNKLAICLIILLGFSFSQTHNTICRIKEFADTTGWYWRMWHVDGSGDLIPQHTVDKEDTLTSEGWDAGPPPYAFWMYNIANWPPPSWSAGDRLLIQADWDSAYGELGHKGFYSIINDTARSDQNPQFTPDDTLRSISNPRPTVWDSINGDTVFTSLDTIDLVWYLPKQTTGNPDTSNILGYALYRDTTGTGEDDTLGNGDYQYFQFVKFVTDTACKDTLPINFDGLIYYCIKLVYRPDTTGSDNEPGFSSRFLSQNSVPIYNTPLVVVEEDCGKYSQSELLEVTPNPFRQRTEIRYQLTDDRLQTTDRHPHIRIYDVTGQLVRQWDDETIKRTDHIIWHGIDDSRKEVPVGVYFVRWSTPNKSLTKKIVRLE